MTLSKSGEIPLFSGLKNANENSMTKEKNGKRIRIPSTGARLQVRIPETMIHYRGARMREMLMMEKRLQGTPNTQGRVRNRRKRLSKKRNGKQPSSLLKAMS